MTSEYMRNKKGGSVNFSCLLFNIINIILIDLKL
jgi:hypothetical protein